MSLRRNYIVIDQIGSGAMATVDKAIQKSLNRFVVIKQIHPELIKNQGYVRRFEREARATAILKHLNIMDVIDFGVEDDRHYLVAEYIDGPNLETMIKHTGQIPLNVALSVIIQILRGLEHIHNNGVIHRDLKPENIMFTRDGIAKLTDFGVAQAAHLPPDPTLDRDIVGTPHFMSPEQARGEKIDQRSDLFSTGVILYELLVGKLPFEGKNKAIVLAKLMHEPHVPVTDIKFDLPRKLSMIVDKALEKDAPRRFFDATEFSHAIERVAIEYKVPLGAGVIRDFFKTTLDLESTPPPGGEATPTQIRKSRPSTTVIKKRRPAVAILPLTGCFGCQVNLLDLHENFTKLHEMIEVQYSYLMDVKKIPKVDIGIVEGSVGNAENEERLMELRDACDVLIALGTCACFGGIPGLRNLYSAQDVTQRAYIESESTAEGTVPDANFVPGLQPSVLPVSNLVQVDAMIPGCPSPPELILQSLEHLINGEPIEMPMQSLCSECPRHRKQMLSGQREYIAGDIHPIMELETINNHICFLEQGVLCMGISTRAGCGGRCVKNNIPCQGCMGPAPHVKETGAKWINTLASLLPGGSMRFRHDLVGIGYCYTMAISLMPHKIEKN